MVNNKINCQSSDIFRMCLMLDTMCELLIGVLLRSLFIKLLFIGERLAVTFFDEFFKAL